MTSISLSIRTTDDTVTLEDGVKPVFIWTGDSVMMGASSEGAGSRAKWTTLPGIEFPQAPEERRVYGYYWDRWQDVSGNTLDNTNRTTTTGTGFVWQQLHPLVGGIASGDYTTVDGPDNQLHPVWFFAKSIYGMFRRASGEIVEPYFILWNAPNTVSGDNGFTVPQQISWEPGVGTPATIFDNYIVEAINAITAGGDTAAVCGMFTNIGTGDINPAADPMTNSTPDNLAVIRRNIEERLADGQAFPWVQLQAYQPANTTSYPPATVRAHKAEFIRFKTLEPSVRLVDWHAEVSTLADGIHPDIPGIIALGTLLGTEYKKHLKFDAGAAAPLVSTSIS